ncbi:MAG: glycosyltransferase family 2 protein, partial [Christensenella sp.]
VIPMSKALVGLFDNELSNYDYEILFIDNCSTDKTRENLVEICKKDHKIKAIFNAQNFGQFNSPFYALCQTTGDCTVSICADFQEPVEMIPKFVKEWESGYKIVCGIKSSSKESGFIYFLRSCYYKLIKKMSRVKQIEHFTGFGLYDAEFMDVLRKLEDPSPFLRGIVAEFGYKVQYLEYEQQKRKSGKTHNNWYSLYDAAMLSITSYTKVGLRVATIAGFVLSAVSILIAIIYLILKLIHWDSFPLGMAPILMGVFFFGSIQLFFIGFLGEYIMNINTRVMKRPLVVEERRINFDDTDKKDIGE